GVELLVHIGRPVRLGLVVERHVESLACVLAYRSALLGAHLAVSVHAQNVFRDLSVPGVFDVIRDDKQQIETGQQRIGKGNVLVGVLVSIVLAKDGVGGRNDTAAG